MEGVTEGRAWASGLEFDYANQESFYCRPLRLSESKNPDRMPFPDEACSVRTAFLPPMSGLAANETRLDSGAIDVRIGEGRTAEVLRNLCYRVHREHQDGWMVLTARIRSLFDSELDPPDYVSRRGEIEMTYVERGVRLDLSSSGRGLQQTLLLLAYMYANPGSVLLLDEPDAHLEILRQREIYQVLTEEARASGSQIIAASHSEILLNEAAGRDLVIAFVGSPHRIGGRGSQLRKALGRIGFEHYYQAERAGWVLYLEGSTDLAMLRAFARRLDHRGALAALERPFVHYVGNQPNAVSEHFHGLREAHPELRGIALFDRLEKGLPDTEGVEWLMWRRREVENYVCSSATLESYAAQSGRQVAPGPLFREAEAAKRVSTMRACIERIGAALETLGHGSPWGRGLKASDAFLDRLFPMYFGELGLPDIFAKTDYHELVTHVPEDEIDPEVREKLDVVARVAGEANPRGDF